MLADDGPRRSTEADREAESPNSSTARLARHARRPARRHAASSTSTAFAALRHVVRTELGDELRGDGHAPAGRRRRHRGRARGYGSWDATERTIVPPTGPAARSRRRRHRRVGRPRRRLGPAGAGDAGRRPAPGRRRRPRARRARPRHRGHARRRSTASRAASCARPRHPSASVVGDADELRRPLRRGRPLDDVYAGIVEALVAAAPSTARCSTRCPARRSSPSARSSCSLADRTGGGRGACRRCRSSTWRGCASASTRSSAGVRLVDGHRFAAEAAGRAGPAARRPVRQPRRAVRHQARGRRRTDEPAEVDRAPAARAARRAHRRGRLGTTSTGPSSPTTSRRCAIPALAAPVAGEVARFAELVRTSAGRVPVGPGADPPEPHPAPARGDLRGARGHRPPRRRRPGDGLRRPRGGAGRPALPGRVPRHAGRRGGPVHAGRRGPGHPRQARRAATRTCSATPRPRAPTRSPSRWEQHQEGREGPGQRDGRHPGRPAGAALRRQGAEKAAVAGRGLAGTSSVDDAARSTEAGPAAARRGRRRAPRPARTPRPSCAWRPSTSATASGPGRADGTTRDEPRLADHCK